MKKFVLGTLIILFCSHAFGVDYFDERGKQNELQGLTILDIGNVKEATSKYGKVNSSDVYELNRRCLTFSDNIGYLGYSGKASMLLTKNNLDYKLAVILNDSKLDFKIIEAEIVDCAKDITYDNCRTVQECNEQADFYLRQSQKFQEKMNRKHREIQVEFERLQKLEQQK